MNYNTYTPGHHERKFAREKNKPVLSAGRIAAYAFISLLIILLWSVLSTAIVVLAGIYAVYKFARLAIGGFACPHCWFGFFIASGIFIISISALGPYAFILVIALLWIDAFNRKTH